MDTTFDFKKSNLGSHKIWTPGEGVNHRGMTK